MKRTLAAVLALCIAGIATSVLGQVPAGRIVVVDLSKVFNDYHKTKSAAEKLKETSESYQKELEEMRAEYNRLTEELAKLREDSERPDYSAEIKEQKRKALQEKLGETQKRDKAIAEYARTHQQLLQDQQLRMRTNILKEVNDVIAKEARSLNFLLVLDKSGLTANGVPSVVFNQENLDITDDILRILNKNAPKIAETKPEPKKESPAAGKKVEQPKPEETKPEEPKPEEKK
jgi:outer membrane protein